MRDNFVSSCHKLYLKNYRSVRIVKSYFDENMCLKPLIQDGAGLNVFT